MFANYNREPTLLERIGDSAGRLCERILNSVENFYKSSLRVDLMEATVSGGLVGAIFCLLNISKSAESLRFIELFLSTLGSYWIAALLLHRYWQGQLRRMVPSWILIPALGVVLAITINSVPTLVSGWSDPYRKEVTVAAYVLQWLRDFSFPFTFFNLLSWPITAVIHYAGPILRGMRL